MSCNLPLPCDPLPGPPGKGFARTLNFPLDRLYALPDAELYRELGFSPGLAPELDVNPYLKLLPMLAGIGSPGTVQEVSLLCCPGKEENPQEVPWRQVMQGVAWRGLAYP